jgi:hypothetical protein
MEPLGPIAARVVDRLARKRRPRRKHIPLQVKVDALLIILGFDPKEPIDWNHNPALGLREYDPETGLYTPDELDPRYLEPMRRADHLVRTNGTKATTAGSDKHRIAKVRHLRGETRAKPKRRWPKRPFPSRANPWGVPRP